MDERDVLIRNLYQSLVDTRALVAIKYGNLDPDVNTILALANERADAARAHITKMQNRAYKWQQCV